jgi:hypothetical protein
MKIDKVTIGTNERGKRWPYAAPCRAQRTHFFCKGETVIENLQERRRRPHNEWRKLFPEIIKYLEGDAEFAKLQEWERDAIVASLNGKQGWRQKAGCPCGCSPAFVSDIASRFTVYVDVA